MAFGLFGSDNGNGPGVDKNRPKKKRFFLFFELFFRKFSKMIYSSLLYCLFLIPSAALTILGFLFCRVAPFDLIGMTLGLALIGPATCGFTYLMRQMSLEQPVFIWHDFWTSFKKNMKQAFAFSALDAVVILFVIISLRFSMAQFTEGVMQYIMVVCYCAIALVFLMMHFYVYLMMITLDLKISQLIKNSLILAIAGIKTNIITVFWVLVLAIIPAFIIAPEFLSLIVLILVPLFYASFIGFIIVFNSFPQVKRLLLDPYYEAHPEALKNNPFGFETEDEDDEPIFTDLGVLEPKESASSATDSGNRSKTIS